MFEQIAADRRKPEEDGMSVLAKTEPNLSLWQIEQALVDLVAAREEVTDPEEVKQVEAALEQYVRAEVAKVDRIAGFIRHANMMAETAQAEANRLSERARMWARRAERVKQMAQDVMEQAGTKRIEGETNTLIVKGNGGVQPLIVTDPEQVPEECCKYVGWIRGKLWGALKEYLSNYDVPADEYRMERTVDNDAVRRALPVPGAHLEERGRHIEIK